MSDTNGNPPQSGRGAQWAWGDQGSAQGHWTAPPGAQPHWPTPPGAQPTPAQKGAQQAASQGSVPQGSVPQQPVVAPQQPTAAAPYAQPQDAQPHAVQQSQPQSQYYAQPQGQHDAYAHGPAVGAGQAPPPAQTQGAGAASGRRRPALIVLSVVLVLLVGAGLGWGVTRFLSGDGGGGGVAQPTAPPPAPEGGGSDQPEDDSGGGSGDDGAFGGPDSGSQETDGASALPEEPTEALKQLAETDEREIVAEVEGSWVPQISSKRTGMEIDGQVWSDEDILADHQTLREEYPDARLLWSGNFGSFKDGNFWITVIADGYSDPEDALDWCRSNGLGADDCYAKQITSGGDHEGTTRLQ